MNPTVEAALISGGWASVVAGLGYVYNRVTAKATIKATNANALVALDASHQAQCGSRNQRPTSTPCPQSTAAKPPGST
jgi:hypothetical protein